MNKLILVGILLFLGLTAFAVAKGGLGYNITGTIGSSSAPAPPVGGCAGEMDFSDDGCGIMYIPAIIK
jgi:hypothetical protein